MRILFLFAMIVSSASVAAAQATVRSGEASNWVMPDVYAAPFVPLVTTPSMSLDNGPPPQVGASNATAGNVAGATDATLSLPSYAPTLEEPLVPGTILTLPGSPAPQASPELNSPTTSFHFGAATFQSDEGVAKLMANAKPPGPPVKTYTNEDIARLNQSDGLVRFGSKTQHLE